MKMELTAKDIRLLKVMFSILTAVLLLRFLILPAMETYQTLTYEREEARQKSEEMQEAIQNLGNSRKLVEKGRQALLTASSSYYPLMEEREIDELVTGLAYRHELFPSRLDMGKRTTGAIAPYLYSKKAEEEAEEAGDSEVNQESKKAPPTYMQSIDAAITLVGAESNVLSLLDDIEKNYPSVQIHSVQIRRNYYMNPTMNLVEETQTNLVLTVFMCEKEKMIRQERDDGLEDELENR